jgi:chromosome partitioning protein
MTARGFVFMALVIAVVSQKGGAGKSTCARLIAREYAQAGWNVKIADLDISQGTSFDWHVRRLQQKLTPSLAVERFGTVEQALKAKGHQKPAKWHLKHYAATEKSSQKYLKF